MEHLSKKRVNKPAFSLMEVLVTITISSLLIGIISIQLPAMKRLSDQFLSVSMFEEPYLIFLLRFEQEFRQAEKIYPSDLTHLATMTFRKDLNLDGDYLDSGEKIAYRWNEQKQRIDRKSGKGYYQAILDGVTYFQWTKIHEAPICYQMELESVYSTIRKQVNFCLTD